MYIYTLTVTTPKRRHPAEIVWLVEHAEQSPFYPCAVYTLCVRVPTYSQVLILMYMFQIFADTFTTSVRKDR